jgi:hypothetical protein
MIPEFRKVYQNGELRIGKATWNEEDRSVKWAYRSRNGRISPRSPEVPIDVLCEMMAFALEKGEVSAEQKQCLLKLL